MKSLFLLRHAKSGEDGFAARDFDRSLNAKGHRAATAIGRYLREQGLAFDLVAASPALRVRETLDAVVMGYGEAIDAQFDQRLYLAPIDDLLAAAREAPDAAVRLLIAGHNPGLERLVLTLVAAGGDAGRRSAVETKYPTASLAELTFDISRWADLAPGTGRLVRFVRPRDLDPALGPDEG